MVNKVTLTYYRTFFNIPKLPQFLVFQFMNYFRIKLGAGLMCNKKFVCVGLGFLCIDILHPNKMYIKSSPYLH